MKRVLITLLSLTVAAPAAVRVVAERVNGGVYYRMSVIDEFSTERVTEQAEAAYRELRSRYGVSVLAFYASVEGASQYCKCVQHVSYRLWRDLYEGMRTSLPPAAEMLILGDRAILRIRSAAGEVDVRHFGSGDLSKVTKNDCEPSILTIAVRPSGGAGPSMRMFVQEISPTPGCAKRAAAEVAKLVPDHWFDIVLRRDRWFIDEPDFPIIYPFGGVEAPPSETWASGFRAYCRVRRGRVECVP